MGSKELNSADAELKDIISGLEGLSLNIGQSQEILVLHAEGWFLMSSNNKKRCGSEVDFCLCVCKKNDCSGEKVICRKTSRIVNFELPAPPTWMTQFKRQNRLLILNTPTGDNAKLSILNLGSIVGEIYSHTEKDEIVFEKNSDTYIVSHQGVLPEDRAFIKFAGLTVTSYVYLRYNSKWEWSNDLKVWKGLDNLEGMDELNKGFAGRFVSAVSKIKDEEKAGKEFLSNYEHFGIKSSQGAYVIKYKTN